MWYVIQVEACHEDEMVTRCQRILKENEEIFTMLSERLERRNNVWETRRFVTFQKYIFADTSDPDDLLIRLREIPGLTKMIKVGEELYPIYPEEEKFLRQIGGEDHIIGKSSVLCEGDKIIVTSGSLVGMEGLVRWTDKRQRLIGVAVNLFNQEKVIKLGAEYVRKE